VASLLTITKKGGRSTVTLTSIEPDVALRMTADTTAARESIVAAQEAMEAAVETAPPQAELEAPGTAKPRRGRKPKGA
jgi:hypothetical protein